MPNVELKWTLGLMFISGLVGAFVHNYWDDILVAIAKGLGWA